MWGFISSVPHFIFCGSHGRPSLLFYFFLKGGVEKREKSMVSLHCQEYQWNYSIVVMKLGFLGMTVKFLLGGCVQDGFSFDMNISTKPWNHEDYLLHDSAYLDSAGR